MEKNLQKLAMRRVASTKVINRKKKNKNNKQQKKMFIIGAATFPQFIAAVCACSSQRLMTPNRSAWNLSALLVFLTRRPSKTFDQLL